MKYIQYANLTYLNTLLEAAHLGDCVLRGTVEAYSCKPVKRDRKLSHIIERRLQEESDDVAGPIAVQDRTSSDMWMDFTTSSLSSGASTDSFSIGSGASTGMGISPSPHNWLYVDSTDTISPEATNIGSPMNDTPVAGAPTVQVYTLLVLALNQSYTYEYDFSKLSRDSFRHAQSLAQVKTAITAHLTKFPRQQDADVVASFWNEVEVITNPAECDIYVYVPEKDENDPMEELTANRLWAEHYFFYHRKQRRIVLFKIQAESPSVRVEMDADAATEDDDEYVSTEKNRDVHYSGGWDHSLMHEFDDDLGQGSFDE